MNCKLRIHITHDFGFLAPYLLRDTLLFGTPPKSSAPRTILYLTPGKSCVRPPRKRTTLCSCKLCPSPWIYANVVLPFVNFTRANLRLAELGFLGFIVPTCAQTPLRWGQLFRAGDLVRGLEVWRAPRMTWLSVARVGEVVWNERGDTKDGMVRGMNVGA